MAVACDMIIYSVRNKMSTTPTPTENTPLTNPPPPPPLYTSYPGPSYVFPGVSARSRRRHMHQFQCCVCSIFTVIAIFALIIAVSYSSDDSATENDSTNQTDESIANDSIILDPNLLYQFLIELEHPLEDEPEIKWTLPEPDLNQKIEAENFGIKSLGDREILEESSAVIPKFSASFRHFHAITTTPEGRKLAKRGYVEYHATFHLAKSLNYTKKIGLRNNIGRGPRLNLTGPIESLKCNFNSRYRTQNGTCNNRKYPKLFGAAMLPFRRALAPDYGDGISKPRLAKSGKELPSARLISLQVHRNSYQSDSNFTVMLAVFGQFLDHDITATALNSGQDGEPIDCCTVALNQHPECFPVSLQAGDPYHDQYNLTCMNFVRSVAAPTGRFGPREQLNQATSFIDGSVVYGNSDVKQNSLRTKQNGQLRMFITPDKRELLPISTIPDDGCNNVEMNAQGKYCFESGDERANENLLLTSMHLLFARHHNYLAKNLQDVHPEWSDEIVFHEARKILGAQLQHITYNEFLPILLGDEFVKSKVLKPDSEKFEDIYNQNVNPLASNNFAASVFRFAHTLLPGLFKISNDNTTTEYIELHKMLFNPFSLWQENGIDQAIGSAIETPVSKVDQYFTKELTERLFEGNPEDKKEKVPLCGLDLVSLNIQRGRDHGLPSYQEFRKHCHLSTAKNWNDMSKMIDSDSLDNIKKLYESPDDVDMYTGALSEKPLKGAIFGPLLACLISDQFIRIKIGDSHWYERKYGPQKFSKEQLNEIYKTTLAGVICQNSDNVHYSQKYVMLKANDTTNPTVNCNDLKNFSFQPWSGDIHQNNQHTIRLNHLQSLVTVLKKSDATVDTKKTKLN